MPLAPAPALASSLSLFLFPSRGPCFGLFPPVFLLPPSLFQANLRASLAYIPLQTSALNRCGLTSVLETRRSCRCCLLLRLHLAPEINGAVRAAVRVRAHLPPGEPARLREAPRTHEALSRRAQCRAGSASSTVWQAPPPGLAPSSSAPRTSASSSQRGLPLPRSLLAPPHLLFSEL